MNPNYTNAYYNLALAHDRLCIYYLASEHFETYLSLDAYKMPKTPNCVEYAKKRIEELKGLLTYTYFYNTGVKFHNKGKYPNAIECYERAIKLNPSFADAYYNLALSQEKIAENHSFQPVLPLFAEADEIKDIHKLVLDNFENYLRLENHELPDNQRYLNYAKKRVAMLSSVLNSE